MEQNILNSIRQLKYDVVDMMKLNVITEGDRFEDFVKKGNKMYGINTVAKR